MIFTSGMGCSICPGIRCSLIIRYELGEGNPYLAKHLEAKISDGKINYWWQWMDRNISKDGITKDLEAIKSTSRQESDLFHPVYLPACG